MNYFEIFGLPVGFQIDQESLVHSYLELQKSAEKDPELLNRAYNVLKDDVKRGEYFLGLRGATTVGISSQIAEEMFKMREEYDALVNSADKKEFQKGLKDQMEVMILSLNNCENDLKKFSEIFGALKFIHSFLEKVRLDVYSRN